MKTGKIFLTSLFILLFMQGCSIGGSADGSTPNQTKVVFTTAKSKVEYIVEIADDREEREKGLMFRTEMSQKHGMLFIYNKPDHLTFWMKNTLIPLDMIFFDGNFKIVHIEKNVQPCKAEPCPVYGPGGGKPAQYVLEVNAGESDNFGMREGDQAELLP